jgi:hypothetical protein
VKVQDRNPIKQYVTHAERFGVEGVMETARDEGLTLSELEELLEACDKIELSHARRTRRFVSAPKRKLTVEQRVKRLCGITDDDTEEAA